MSSRNRIFPAGVSFVSIASIASIAFLPVLSTPTFLLLAFTFASPCLVQAVRNVCVQLQKNI